MRFVSLLAAAFVAACLPAAACDLNLAHRGAAVADYVEAVQPCLADMPAGYWSDGRMEAEFLKRVNAERTSRGLKPLRYRPELLDAARFQSLDMAYNHFFGHEAPDGRMPHDRVAAFDRSALIEYSAENVAMIEVTGGHWDLERKAVPRLHQNLMDSPGHRKNILNPDITDVAMGVVRTDHGVWITQVFMDLSGTLPHPLPVRMRPGQTIDMKPTLRDWTFQHFEAKRGEDSYQTLAGGIPATLNGDFGLAAFSRKKGEKPGLIYTIRLPGPAVTVGG
ncbi:MAG: CAP domain-containing protein [Hyphomonas sp.]|uniref:CAP domain-containing protein n=1 Tax=Hyphomonas sp. TaxID=87 RepID=UPI0035282C6F